MIFSFRVLFSFQHILTHLNPHLHRTRSTPSYCLIQLILTHPNIIHIKIQLIKNLFQPKPLAGLCTRQTAKHAAFAECLGPCTRQTSSLCRVSGRYDTRQSHRHRYPSVPSFFCRGPSRHSAKCLPSAR